VCIFFAGIANSWTTSQTKLQQIRLLIRSVGRTPQSPNLIPPTILLPFRKEFKRQANIARIERKSGSEPSSALNQVNNQDDDRNYEQEMDQTAANVPKKAKKPEHDQDNNYSPEHGIPFGWVNFRRPIYPEIYLLAKLFRNVDNRTGKKS
jgi:hypothetical protein